MSLAAAHLRMRTGDYISNLTGRLHFGRVGGDHTLPLVALLGWVLRPGVEDETHADRAHTCDAVEARQFLQFIDPAVETRILGTQHEHAIRCNQHFVVTQS